MLLFAWCWPRPNVRPRKAVPSAEIRLGCGVCIGLCVGVSPKYVEGSVKSSLFNCLFFFPFSIRSVMQKYLEERGELTFDKIFHQKIGESHCNGMQFSCIP